MAEFIHVSDFGAVGDGITPDDAAIQLAINKSIEANKPVQFSAKTYLIQNELLVSNFIALQGVPRCGSQGPDNSSQGRTILRAGTKGMRSIMAITGNRSVRIQDIIFDANMKAMQGLYLMGVSLSSFERIGVGGACSDGIHQPKKDDAGNDTINDTNVWRELSCSRNGTLYVTPDLKDVDQVVSSAQIKVLNDAEISIDPSSRLVTCSGTDFDLTELGLRTGDPMRIIGDSYDQYCFILEVRESEQQLLISEMADFPPAPKLPNSKLSFMIGRGDGYHEVRHGDNNASSFYNGLFRSNAGYAFAFAGLYGPNVIGHQIDYHPFWALRFGTRGSEPVLGARVIGVYFERINRKPFLLVSTNNIGIYHPMDHGYDDPVDYAGHQPTNTSGLYVNQHGLKPIARMKNHLETTYLAEATAHHNLYFRPWVMQPVNVSEPNDPPSVFPIMRPGLTDITLEGKPSFKVKGRSGKLMILLNEGPAAVTIQDESVLQGSGFKLSTSTYTMGARDSITLVCDSRFWTETSRTQTI